MKKRRNFIEDIKDTLGYARSEELTLKEKETLWKNILNQTIDSPRSQRWYRQWQQVGTVAVLTVVAICALYFFKNPHVAEGDIVSIAKNNKVYFQSNGTIQLLDADKKSHEIAADSFINYNHGPAEPHLASATGKDDPAMRFNSINVPYGKRTEIQLEDGSKVWLNAGSVLTFPEHFATRQREIYLEGEGYFEVAHDAERPFIVRSANMDVNVLGTTFNLSVYADDPQHTAVLLSGNIEVRAAGKNRFNKQTLKPGMMAAIDSEKGTINVQEALVEESISWTKRQLLLNQMPLSDIKKKLERVYNTEIIDQSGLPGEETFSGSLDLSQPLLGVLQNVYDEEGYLTTQIERRIYIKRK